MPSIPDFSDIDLEIINILIKKEREEQENAQKQPFLQLPMPIPPLQSETTQKDEENSSSVIEIDM